MPYQDTKNLPDSWNCPRCEHVLTDILRGGRIRIRRSIEAVYAIESGAVIVCPWCSVPHVFPWPDADSEIVENVQDNDLIHMMEERWQQFRVAKLRERGNVAVGLRFDVFHRDGFRCRYCGVSVDDGVILHADHVIPQSKGGPTTLENLVTACHDCNLGKSDKDLTP